MMFQLARIWSARVGLLLDCLVPLQKWQRNNVFEAIQETGLHPDEFRWEQNDDEDYLTHPGSSSHFTFRGVPGRYELIYIAGDGVRETRTKQSWQTVLDSVNIWLHDVKQDVETPDLWAELQARRRMLGADPAKSIENTPFTPKEQAEIAKRLREIKVYVTKTYSLPEEDLLELDTRLAYLEEAAHRLGRLDWRNAFLGALIGYVMAAALPPDMPRVLFEIFVRTLSQLFGHDFPGLTA